MAAACLESKMFDVYVLKSSTGKTYIGHTDALERRMSEHNQGFSKATKPQEDWRLVYSESQPTRALAMKREKFFKTGDGRKVLRNKGVV